MYPINTDLIRHRATRPYPAYLPVRQVVEALQRGRGILSISEMSRLSGVSRQDIYRILQRAGMELRA